MKCKLVSPVTCLVPETKRPFVLFGRRGQETCQMSFSTYEIARLVKNKLRDKAWEVHCRRIDLMFVYEDGRLVDIEPVGGQEPHTQGTYTLGAWRVLQS